MPEIQRGYRGKIEDSFDISKEITVSISVSGAGSCDSCCFGVDSAGKLSDDRYMVFYNQTASPGREITQSGGGADTSYAVNLSKLPDGISKLAFTVSIDGEGSMGRIQNLAVKISQGANSLVLNMTGANFQNEKSVIAVELYKKDFWRISAVASGFNEGFSTLLKHYGGKETVSAPTPAAREDKAPLQKLVSLTKPIKVSLEKHKTATRITFGMVAAIIIAVIVSGFVVKESIELLKGQTVNLEESASTGEILINLNWSQNGSSPIDLDLGCMVECASGESYLIQALEPYFGASDEEPYITLDVDDRTGAAADGENLRLNGIMMREIKRIFVFAFIYDGVLNWQDADGVITIKYPGGADIIVKLDEYSESQGMCAIARFVNVNGTMQVEKLVRFFDDHEEMDKAYDWGFSWEAGFKDEI